jgi:hypothetical protein
LVLPAYPAQQVAGVTYMLRLIVYPYHLFTSPAHYTITFHTGPTMSLIVTTTSSSTTSSDIYNPSLSSAGRLCHHCSSLGSKIRQLCEVEDFTITVPHVLVEKNRWTCAFCEMIASHPRFGPGDGKGDFIVHNKRDKRYEYLPRPTDGIDGLRIERGSTSTRMDLVELSVFTTDG